MAFDVAGTLYVCPELDRLVDDQAFVALARARDWTLDEARTALQEQRAKNRVDRGDNSKVGALEALGVPGATFQDAAAEIDPSALLAGAPPIGPLFAKLRSAGLRVGILSNFKKALVDRIFDALSVEWRQIDASICVDDGLPIKPSPIPFQALCARLGVPATEALFVGDSLSKDLAPAKRLGMTTVLVEGGKPDGDPADADHRLASVLGIDALLGL